ncbi:ribonuclease H-like domain-containing protein [Candidatus Woesearchaeota archaeon]|nr:ribonuclease H-like domain-containing protein [Candidatus Woesearchaeota archaeon]
MENYFIIDIETCPFDITLYESLDEKERIKLLNPIDSRIVAIGVRYRNETKIFMDNNEVKILNDFWNEFKSAKQENKNCQIVGFNINHFDMPFLVSRSFINNVEIVPFLLKNVIDIREKINVYRYGKSKGKLCDFGRLLGLKVSETDGSHVAGFWKENKLKELRGYLENDLMITEEMFKRANETNIINIGRW